MPSVSEPFGIVALEAMQNGTPVLASKQSGVIEVTNNIVSVDFWDIDAMRDAVLNLLKDPHYRNHLISEGRNDLYHLTWQQSAQVMKNIYQEVYDSFQKHQQMIEYYFQYKPTVFRNTELIYSNGIADMVESMGFKAMLTEGVDRILDWRSPNFIYEPINGRGMKLLMKNYKLSDDIAFRFSQSSWKDWPLTSEKFAHWLHKIDGQGDIINLFMDYETIGEHQWVETGIFEFFRALPEAVFKHPKYDFSTPSEVINHYPPVEKISIPDAISWADSERDLSAWLGNPMQDSSIAWLYQLSDRIKKVADPHLLHTWRKLQTSDHFYYMCTKFWNDGSVHQYFSSYETPHDSFVILNNILTDMELRLENLEEKIIPTPAPTIKPLKTRVPRLKKVPQKISSKK